MAIVSTHVAGAAKIHILGFMRSHSAQRNVLTDNMKRYAEFWDKANAPSLSICKINDITVVQHAKCSLWNWPELITCLNMQKRKLVERVQYTDTQWRWPHLMRTLRKQLIKHKSCSPVALGDELKVVLSHVLAPLGMHTLQTYIFPINPFCFPIKNILLL